MPSENPAVTARQAAYVIGMRVDSVGLHKHRERSRVRSAVTDAWRTAQNTRLARPML